MAPSITYFDLPKELSSGEVIACLGDQFTVTEHPARAIERTFLDTFDWRLHTASLQLERETEDTHHTYLLRRDDTQRQTLASARGSAAARFCWDFPETALRRELSPVIDARALLAVVALRCKLQEYSLTNKQGKTVLRVRIERNRLGKNSKNPYGKSGVLLYRTLVLQALRGYRKHFEAAAALLQERFGLTPGEHDVYFQALLKSKILPGHYSSKLDIPLELHMRADAASKKILLHLLDTLEANWEGTIANIDSEFLHDLRVACRRTRSALGQIKKVFPKKITEHYSREFAWIGGITGPTRDMDVYLLSFDDYKQKVPAHLQNALEPLREFLRRQQELEHQKLARALQSGRYQKLISRWRRFLQSPAPERASAANAQRPIVELANERTWKMYRRVIAEGAAIHQNSPPEDLHELRKSCKKLRYLMEFFHNLYAAESIAKCVKALKQLQTNLGDYNDLHVQIASLERFSNLMLAHEHPTAETLLAMGSLIESLDQKQQAVRREFEAQFRHFNAPEYHTLFAALFSGSVTPPASNAVAQTLSADTLDQ